MRPSGRVRSGLCCVPAPLAASLTPRPPAGVTAAKTFDLLVRMKSGVDHLFRGIPRRAGLVGCVHAV